MIKEIKYILFVVIIFAFIFFTIKHYYSDANIKNSFRSLESHSFKIADLTLTAPFRYSVLIWGSLFGFLFFNEIPDFFTWIGGTIIFLSILILTYYESKNDEV